MAKVKVVKSQPSYMSPNEFLAYLFLKDDNLSIWHENKNEWVIRELINRGTVSTAHEIGRVKSDVYYHWWCTNPDGEIVMTELAKLYAQYVDGDITLTIVEGQLPIPKEITFNRKELPNG